MPESPVDTIRRAAAEIADPLAPGELDELAGEIRALGFDVALTWNGHPGITGSVGLKRPAHPSLIGAVNLYRAGCPQHPHRYVFCECGWYRTGNALLVKPPLNVSSREVGYTAAVICRRVVTS